MPRYLPAGLLLLSGCTLDGSVTVHKPHAVRACNGPVFPAPTPPPVVYSAPTEMPEPTPAEPVDAVPAPTGWKPVRSDPR